MTKPTYTQLADTLSALIGAFSEIDAMLDNYMSQCDASKAESKASKAANRVHARAITVCAAAVLAEPAPKAKRPSKDSLARAALVIEGNHPWIYYANVIADYGLDDSFVWTAQTLAPYVELYLRANQ